MEKIYYKKYVEKRKQDEWFFNLSYWKLRFTRRKRYLKLNLSTTQMYYGPKKTSAIKIRTIMKRRY